ncbi:MAG TPA: hypothetical protein VMH01_14965 [Puia sp.]|nr:hypothetical protein [Puia sp.]
MKQTDYHCSITVSKSAEESFTKINSVSSWWTENLEGSSRKLNDIFTIRFGETFVTMKIIESIPNKKILWQVTDCRLHWLNDKKEWNATKINWEISNKNGLTHINMTHIGLVPKIECYKDCEKGWNFYVGESLFKLITEEKGLPEKKIKSQQVSM